MSGFEQLFEENKDAFDRLNPKAESWNDLSGALRAAKVLPKKEKRGFFFLKVAAAILLLIGGASIWYLNIENTATPFDNIAFVSPEGNTIHLDPSLNKYTLVQFWESGNVLCSDDNCYYYLPAYEKYKEEGFEIYAISLDENKALWVDGIAENELPWIHVSDGKGWDSPLCIECNITKVPTSFLLNQNGEIIARDLEAKELDETLSRLLAQN